MRGDLHHPPVRSRSSTGQSANDQLSQTGKSTETARSPDPHRLLVHLDHLPSPDLVMDRMEQPVVEAWTTRCDHSRQAEVGTQSVSFAPRVSSSSLRRRLGLALRRPRYNQSDRAATDVIRMRHTGVPRLRDRSKRAGSPAVCRRLSLSRPSVERGPALC